MVANDLTSAIKQKAIEIGFAACGISKTTPLLKERARLNRWTSNAMHGDMDYLAKNTEVRTDPSKILENARSVISLLYNYFPAHTLPEENNFRVARYAYGKDYHVVIRQKLDRLIDAIKDLEKGAMARGFVDSGPVMEKPLAQRSGLGWLGKNTLLINPDMGSFVFIADIITDLELAPDAPSRSRCGSCQQCLLACPTGALVAPYTLDVRRCIAYLTIEFKGELPPERKNRFGNRIYGCDACQDACPYNRNAIPHNDPDLTPLRHLKEMTRDRWLRMTSEEFDTLFHQSAIHRVTYPMLKRNIDFIGSSS